MTLKLPTQIANVNLCGKRKPNLASSKKVVSTKRTVQEYKHSQKIDIEEESTRIQ